MEDVIDDVEHLTGRLFAGKCVYMACLAMYPWLREKITDQRLWNGELDPRHFGDLKIEPMNEQEREDMWNRYLELRQINRR